jgi:hypothetical protein
MVGNNARARARNGAAGAVKPPCGAAEVVYGAGMPCEMYKMWGIVGCGCLALF